ncbi:MAG: RNA-binding protein [Deltaproteobacteria bacterium]|nr:RNA-binding protein [Deltaproteobacteria bacterium]
MNIYAGNLSYEVTEEDLKNAFSAFGEVTTVKVIKDEYSGRSKGFGFIEMTNKTEGDAAINGLNNTELKGRAIKVNEANPKRDTRSSGGGRDGGSRDGGGRGRQGGGGSFGKRRY